MLSKPLGTVKRFKYVSADIPTNFFTIYLLLPFLTPNHPLTILTIHPPKIFNIPLLLLQTTIPSFLEKNSDGLEKKKKVWKRMGGKGEGRVKEEGWGGREEDRNMACRIPRNVS